MWEVYGENWLINEFYLGYVSGMFESEMNEILSYFWIEGKNHTNQYQYDHQHDHYPE